MEGRRQPGEEAPPRPPLPVRPVILPRPANENRVPLAIRIARVILAGVLIVLGSWIVVRSV
jgi:hypothetical protein